MNMLKWEFNLFISIYTLIDWVAFNFNSFVFKLYLYMAFLCKILFLKEKSDNIFIKKSFKNDEIYKLGAISSFWSNNPFFVK